MSPCVRVQRASGACARLRVCVGACLDPVFERASTSEVGRGGEGDAESCGAALHWLRGRWEPCWPKDRGRPGSLGEPGIVDQTNFNSWETISKQAFGFKPLRHAEEVSAVGAAVPPGADWLRRGTGRAHWLRRGLFRGSLRGPRLSPAQRRTRVRCGRAPQTRSPAVGFVVWCGAVAGARAMSDFPQGPGAASCPGSWAGRAVHPPPPPLPFFALGVHPMCCPCDGAALL